MRAFITGVTGFAGSHLAGYLIGKGDEVLGLLKTGTDLENLSDLRAKVLLFRADICDGAAVKGILEEASPDVIYHLAAEASSGRSLKNPREALEINVLGTLNVLEAARGLPSLSKILLVSSAEVYGVVQPEQLPITEKAELRPVHPYATSKVAVHFLGYQYLQAYRIPVVEARAFNHIGPRQSLDFVVPDLAKQLAEIKVGIQKANVAVGDLSAQRDFTDVRDVVRAYQLLAERGKAGEVYQVCSGRAYSIRQILDMLISIADIDVTVFVDEEKLRPVETPLMVGSREKIKNELGWEPMIPLRKTLEDTFEYWLERVKAQKAQKAAT